MRLCRQPLVPAGREIHVRIELQEPVLAAVEGHGDGAGPARAARVDGIDAQVAGTGGHARRVRRLLDHAEMKPVGAARIVARALERETEERIAVGDHAHEDGHRAEF
jgi:hypothetical protein